MTTHKPKRRTTFAVILIALLIAPFATYGRERAIPRGLGALFAAEFEGKAVAAAPISSFPVPQHPFLAADGTNSMHNDAYATDAYKGPGPLGRDPVVTSSSVGLEECATLAFDRSGRLIGLCGDALGPELKQIDPKTLEILATHELPGRKLRSDAAPWEDLCGGAYFYMDHDGRAVVATTDRQIRVISVSKEELRQERVYDLTSVVPSEDCLIALMPDWIGRVWFVTSNGRVGAVDPETGVPQVVTLPGERIANSVATDESGGLFVVSDHALYRFSAESGAPKATWRVAYDRGTRHKPGQLSWGSGTTPTLFGNGMVAITDNAEPRMNVVVYNRHSGSFVCQEPVFKSGESATDNSLIAIGNSLFVENNYGYRSPFTTLFGGTTTPGVTRVEVTKDGCETVWESEEIAPTCVPKASLATGLIYVYAKSPDSLLGAWYFTAIDARTGKTMFRVLTGTGIGWNNHYAAITLGPDGTAYIATLFGIVRIQG